MNWILLLVAGALLLWSLTRERFEETSTIRKPPYFDSQHRRIYTMLEGSSQDILLKKAKAEKPLETNQAKLEALAGSYVGPAVESFFTTVYKPSTTTLTVARVDDFMASRTGPLKAIEREAVIAYFLGQAGPHSSGYLDILAGMGQRGTGGTGPAEPAAPAAAAAAAATGGTGASPPAPAAPAASASTGGTGTSGPRAGGTTGGSSNSAAAPNAGGVPGRQIFGPLFTSLGSPISGGSSSEDSSETNQYPTLLGGMGDTTSVRRPGGIGTPSQNWLLSQSGSLPSTASLGTDANSGYLPYSRVPGDQDLIPDPYRLNRNFSTSSYSSKTDPVPFLTNFSAFFR